MLDKQKNIDAVILAAGASSRMGRSKALLRVGKTTFAGLIQSKLNKAGIKNIYLVLGARANYIKKNLNTEGLNIIINNSWEKGQLSSLKKAVKKLSPETDAFLMCLIDHPQVKLDTLNKIIKTYLENVFRKKAADIVLPEYKGRGGHPVIFSRSVFKELLRVPLNKGARAVVRNKKNNVIRVKVNDRYIRQDIDTEKEYNKVEPKKSDI
ncbi:MAG: nucleotidyltransferase family protein [Elusimicrobia bacterium]|jgi:molybdenum cofactor cytidylyltransferase|nr:nucleotidyltransferase family protein [Elusimicrobiota bacterium]